MAFGHGKATKFFLQTEADTVNTSITEVSDWLREVSFPRNLDVAETTVFGAGVKSYVQGISDARISLSGLWDPTVDAFFSWATTAGALEWAYAPAGLTGASPYTLDTTSVKYYGKTADTNPLVICVSYQAQGSVGDVVGFSAEFQFTAGSDVTEPVGRITSALTGKWATVN